MGQKEWGWCFFGQINVVICTSEFTKKKWGSVKKKMKIHFWGGAKILRCKPPGTRHLKGKQEIEVWTDQTRMK